jgi:hypothetical protein
MTNRLLGLVLKVGDPASIERWAREGHLPLLGWTLASDMPGDPHAGVLGVRAAIA